MFALCAVFQTAQRHVCCMPRKLTDVRAACQEDVQAIAISRNKHHFKIHVSGSGGFIAQPCWQTTFLKRHTDNLPIATAITLALVAATTHTDKKIMSLTNKDMKHAEHSSHARYMCLFNAKQETLQCMQPYFILCYCKFMCFPIKYGNKQYSERMLCNGRRLEQYEWLRVIAFRNH